MTTMIADFRACRADAAFASRWEIVGRSWPIQPPAGNAGWASWFQLEHHRPGVPELERWLQRIYSLLAMNIKIKEDSRTFQEFYPDPTMRHQVHYAFAHKFLPQYVQQNPFAFFSYIFRQDMPGGAMEPTRFIHSRWTMFEETAGLIQPEDDLLRDGMVLRRVSDLTMSTQEAGGRPVALVQMPTPEQPVEVFFVAVALLASPAHPESWPRDVQARVFTLEAEFSEHPGEGVVCEWTKEGEHRNFGFGVRAERDAFLRAVTAALQAPDAPARASFTPPKDDGASATIAPRTGGDSPPPQQPQLPSETRKPWWKIW